MGWVGCLKRGQVLRIEVERGITHKNSYEIGDSTLYIGRNDAVYAFVRDSNCSLLYVFVVIFAKITSVVVKISASTDKVLANTGHY